MRDSDLGFTTRLIVKSGSLVTSIKELAGKRVAFGSRDSAQAAVIPEFYLREAGLKPGADYDDIRFNTDIGKHGDTGRSEIDVVNAVRNGEADCGAIGETMYQSLLQSASAAEFVSIWTSPPYSHCNFTALPQLAPGRAEKFVTSLMRMDYNNPSHRVVLEMEGLKQWVTGDRRGYESVFRAVDATGYLSEMKTVGAST